MLPAAEEDKLLLIPGPTPVSREILAALATPVISHTSHEMERIFSHALDLLRELIGTQEGKIFVFSGSGTLAQEAAILNFVDPTDRLLVASTGFFADRLTEVARAHGLDVSSLQTEWGKSIPPEELKAQLAATGASVVAFTHVETSTGVMAPLADLLTVIHEAGALAIVDGVAALAGVPEPMDEIAIDVLLSGSQKALGVPPGLAIIAAGEKAWEKRVRRAAPLNTFYLDLCRWLPIMKQPDKYFSTHPVNLIRGLTKALEIVDKEGLEERYDRHRRLAHQFRQGMLGMGFSLFTDPWFVAPTLSVLRVPSGERASVFRERLHSNGVVAASGLQDPDDRVVRFGHMGNITEAEIAIALDAVRRSLRQNA